MTEPAEPDFEVIVIGAGIAGCVAAYQLARQGRSVLLIERGEAPGSKNLSGGVLYSRGIQQVFPDFLAEAPVERRITRNYISFLNAGQLGRHRLQGRPAGRPGQRGHGIAGQAGRVAGRRSARRPVP